MKQADSFQSLLGGPGAKGLHRQSGRREDHPKAGR